MFSYHEEKLLKSLGRRKMNIRDLSESFYGRALSSDLAKRNYVACVVRRIKAKCDKAKLEWTLLGEGSGRSGRTVWRGKRRAKRN